MAKYKRIPGTLNNLADSYFSTMRYYDRGYMADWIWKIGIENQTWDLKIDLLNKKCEPKFFNIKPIVVYLESIQKILYDDCKKDEIPLEYISQCWFEIELRKQLNRPMVYCTPKLKGNDGKYFKGKELITEAYDLMEMKIKSALFRFLK